MNTEKGLTGYPSIDKPWLKYYTENDLKIKVPKCTIYQNIYNCNKDYPHDIAINYFGNKISYKKMFENTTFCAKSLHQIGIKRGDCVTLCTAGVPEAIYIILACSRIGAIANFINPLFSKDQMIARINETNANWIFILDEMYSYIEDALTETYINNVVIIPSTNSIAYFASKILYIKSKARKILSEKTNYKQKHISWRDFMSIGNKYSGKIDVSYEPDTSVIMVYSSGTTGASKGILLTNDGINATIANYGIEAFDLKRKDVYLAMVPVWFSTGIVYCILLPLVKGFVVALDPVFSKEQFAKDLKKYKPTMTLVATGLWLYAANTKSMQRMNLSSMNYPITGGDKVLQADENRINDFLKETGCKKKFYKGYGMCELGSVITGTTDAPNYVDKHGGCGYPILNVIVSVFDVNTDKELKYNEHGEIRVCSPARMKGYYKRPDATADFFKSDCDGRIWGCTGDIGYIDEDGEVFVLGRKNDSFISSSGKTIYCFDIEDVILQNNCISRCKVVSIKRNDMLVPVAHIVKTSECNLSDNELINQIHESCIKLLDIESIPYGYIIRTELPIKKSGKMDIEALKKDTNNIIKP